MSEEENIEEQSADNSPQSTENENISEPSITNEQPLTKNMEVHHHTHPGHHKKKWTDYVLEFFMLFLAVFLGFVAENIREHNVENNRSKEYAISLVQDLQNDTTAINIQMKSGKIYTAIADSLLNLSNSALEGKAAAEFSFYTRFMYWTVPLIWNRATFEQIKNSGSLRYFKNYQLLDKLMKYDELVNEIQGEFNNHQTRGNMLLNQINKIIELGIHHDLSAYLLLALDTMSIQTKEHFFSAKIESLENKRDDINEMLNMVIVQQRNIRFNNERLQRAKELANELITDFNKEYHLENE